MMTALQHAFESNDWGRAVVASRGVVTLFDEGGLTNPRLAIAHEIEEDILDITQAQNIWVNGIILSRAFPVVAKAQYTASFVGAAMQPWMVTTN